MMMMMMVMMMMRMMMMTTTIIKTMMMMKTLRHGTHHVLEFDADLAAVRLIEKLYNLGNGGAAEAGVRRVQDAWWNKQQIDYCSIGMSFGSTKATYPEANHVTNSPAC